MSHTTAATAADRVQLNVRGVPITTTRTTLASRPDWLVPTQLAHADLHPLDPDGSLFVDADPAIMAHVLRALSRNLPLDADAPPHDPAITRDEWRAELEFLLLAAPAAAEARHDATEAAEATTATAPPRRDMAMAAPPRIDMGAPKLNGVFYDVVHQGWPPRLADGTVDRRCVRLLQSAGWRAAHNSGCLCGGSCDTCITLPHVWRPYTGCRCGGTCDACKDIEANPPIEYHDDGDRARPPPMVPHFGGRRPYGERSRR